MKNLFVLAVAFAAAASLSSCKKDYTCECKYSGQTYSYTYKDSKSGATETCDAQEKNLKSISTDANCEIK